MKTNLIFTTAWLFVTFAFAQTPAQNQTAVANQTVPVTLEVQSSSGVDKKNVNGRIVFKLENSVPLIFVSVVIDFADAVDKVTLEVDGESRPIPFKKNAKSLMLFLPSTKGKLQLRSQDKITGQVNFGLAPTRRFFTASPNCQENVVSRILTQDASNFVGGIYCKSQNGVLTELTFSSMADAEWLGSDVFEISGKGERWKVFAGKDFTTTDTVNMSWGQADRPVKVLMKKKKIKTPEAERNLFVVEGGLGFTSIGVKKVSGDASTSGQTLFLQGRFYPGRGNWQLGGEYQTLIMGKTTDKGTASLSEGKGFGGYEYNPGSWTFVGQLGYMTQSLSVPEVGIILTMNAPFVRGSAGYNWSSSALTLGVSQASTSSAGAKSTGSGISLRYSFVIKEIKFFTQFNSNNYQYSDGVSETKSTTQGFQIGLSY